MEQDNQELTKLQAQLQEALAAEQFFNQSSGKLIVELFTKEINKLLRDITSEKYRKDFSGYNNALSDLLAYKKILKSLQVAASPKRLSVIREKMKEIKESEQNA